MAGFAINPPTERMVNADGYPTPSWYRFFSRVQGAIGADAVALIQAAPILTYSATAALSNDKILTAGAGIGLTSAATTLTVALTASGVTAAAYGNAATVPTFTVDTYGRLTLATDVAIAISASAITSGTLAVARGGTGLSSYTVGDLIYASGATTLSNLGGVATGNALISGGVGVAPAWGKIGLTTHVSGTLPVANGGTELSTTPTNGQLLIGNGTNYTLATLTGTANQVTVTNGAGSITLSLPATINVNTSGSAATLTTSRNIYGNAFNGSADITAIIASTYGGTGNGFTKFSGPAAAEKTFTLPNASATILTDNAVVTAAQGGTGVSNTGTVTLGGNFTTSGAFTTTLTVTANTNVTLPTTGTVATRAGSETFTNKTITAPILNATPSTNWGLDFAPSTSNGSYVSIADTGTYDLAVGSGMIFLWENAGNGVAQIALYYGTAAIVWQSGALYTTAVGTANKVNVYYNGTTAYRIQNLTGATVNIYVSTMRFRDSS